jgi:hypothetical protein
MATTITFTDSVGAATLKNGKTSPADRFANWTPMSRPVGDVGYSLATGAMTRVRVRTDYGASFELRNIPVATVSTVRLVEVADRLIAHLLNGGTCAVNTGDASSSAYATCGLMPGTSPSLQQSNSSLLEYDLSLSLINLAGSPVQMVCRYGSVSGT